MNYICKTMNNILDFLQKLLGKYSDFKHFTVSWFVYLAWAPCILWGLYDGMLYILGKDKSDENLTNFYIRTGVGCILFLIWFFLLRSKGKRN